jgi:hypothetical protein
MSLLRRGGIITDFALPSTAGGEPFLSDVRGRSAMVLVLAATAPDAVRMLLREGAVQNPRIRTSDAKLCVVLAMPLAEAREAASRGMLAIRRAGGCERSSTPPPWRCR